MPAQACAAQQTPRARVAVGLRLLAPLLLWASCLLGAAPAVAQVRSVLPAEASLARGGAEPITLQLAPEGVDASLGGKWLGTWLLMKWMPLRLFLTPKHIKMRRVRARAIDLFKVGTESKTVGRTGVLLYLSMREHRAEIVADEAIASKVAPEVWGDAMIALIDNLREGRPGEGMAEAVRQMGVVLAEHFPKGSENPNELPDRLIEI